MVYQDLLKDTSAVAPDDNNKFIVTILDLDISTIYKTQFRWKYKDKTFGDWSAVKTFATDGESFGDTPSTLTAIGGAGFITVTWNGKNSAGADLANFKQLDVYIAGAPFDSTKPASTFFSAGTKTIAAPAGTYILTSYAVSVSGTKSLLSTATDLITVTSSVIQVDPSVTPSQPTVSSVLGAIQLAWNGKTSNNTDQPSGFKAAKVYVGTSAGFTPSSSNQVDVLNFGNGQNTLNIGLGTLVDGVALNHGIDYYVKIATTNGTDTSTAVAANGNPVRVGQVQNGSLVAITADKITSGTISSQTITVGAPTGKRVELRGSGNPFEIFGTGGTSLLSYDAAATKLTITGDGTFTGNISGASGTFTGSLSVGSAYTDNTVTPSVQRIPFSVDSSGVINASSGRIGGWTLGPSYLQNTSGTFRIDSGSLNPESPAPAALSFGNLSGLNIKITPTGIATYNVGTIVPGFNLATTGILTLSGGIISGGSIDAAEIIGGSITGSSFSTTGLATSKRIVMSANSNKILFKTASTDLDINNNPYNVDGLLQMDNTDANFLGLGNFNLGPGLRLQPPARNNYDYPAYMTMVNHPNGGGVEIGGISTVVKGWLQANHGTTTALPAVRNIKAFAGAPAGTDGIRGDVWFQI